MCCRATVQSPRIITVAPEDAGRFSNAAPGFGHEDIAQEMISVDVCARFGRSLSRNQRSRIAIPSKLQQNCRSKGRTFQQTTAASAESRSGAVPRPETLGHKHPAIHNLTRRENNAATPNSKFRTASLRFQVYVDGAGRMLDANSRNDVLGRLGCLLCR